jgi:hypothetical protein
MRYLARRGAPIVTCDMAMWTKQLDTTHLRLFVEASLSQGMLLRLLSKK